jgi:hypothetical protein
MLSSLEHQRPTNLIHLMMGAKNYNFSTWAVTNLLGIEKEIIAK